MIKQGHPFFSLAIQVVWAFLQQVVLVLTEELLAVYKELMGVGKSVSLGPQEGIHAPNRWPYTLVHNGRTK